MDFVVGILLMIIIILFLYNFSSISLSDSTSNGTCNKNVNQNQYNSNRQYNSVPSPVLSKSPSALNNKVNLNAQTYDYSKYFFV